MAPVIAENAKPARPAASEPAKMMTSVAIKVPWLARIEAKYWPLMVHLCISAVGISAAVLRCLSAPERLAHLGFGLGMPGAEIVDVTLAQRAEHGAVVA